MARFASIRIGEQKAKDAEDDAHAVLQAADTRYNKLRSNVIRIRSRFSKLADPVGRCSNELRGLSALSRSR